MYNKDCKIYKVYYYNNKDYISFNINQPLIQVMNIIAFKYVLNIHKLKIAIQMECE